MPKSGIFDDQENRITGAAAGIGCAIARSFHAAGWDLGLYDIDADGVAALAKSLGAGVIHSRLDVTDAQAWQQQLAVFNENFSRLDLLVNNAGILHSGPFEETALDQHKATLDINVLGVKNGCHCALPYLRNTNNSCVINMASASAMYGQPSLVSYAASKFAVRGLTEGLNLEWRKHGVRVIDIWPIFVQTKMVTGMRARSIKKLGVKLTPEDVASVVLKAANAGANSRQVHWLVGVDAKLLNGLLRFMPQAIAGTVVGKVTGEA